MKTPLKFGVLALAVCLSCVSSLSIVYTNLGIAVAQDTAGHRFLPANGVRGTADSLGLEIDGSLVGGLLDHGTNNTINIDPAYDGHIVTITANGTFTLATNSVTAGKRKLIAVKVIDQTGGHTMSLSSGGTGGASFASPVFSGFWGTNSATAGATNTYFFEWDTVWHDYQDTALIAATQVQWMSGVNSAVLTDISTNTLTGKTFDASGTGNVLKFNDRMPFVGPWRVDGTGCVMGTTNTSSYNGLAIYASSASTNANYAVFVPDAIVPTDLDSGVTMTAKLGFAIVSTDTTSETFTIGYYQPASGSVFATTDYTGFSGYISFTTGTLTGAAANKIYYVTVTLTGWAAALTADRHLRVGIARAGAANANQIVLVEGCITYGRSQ